MLSRLNRLSSVGQKPLLRYISSNLKNNQTKSNFNSLNNGQKSLFAMQKRHNPAVRVIVQLIIMGGGVVAKAISQSVQRVLSQSGGTEIKQTFTLEKNAMNENHALEILNLNKNYTLEELQEKYEKYYNANDPAKGGSFYIQSKVLRSYEYLLKHKEEEKQKNLGKPTP